ncbi:hypothetical protein [Listeria booriae]|uniref:Uncharacterized protein n=1 Tax=Listeria booriae TaxID=1552123 RepID=A0A841Y0B1_9LIST|nr:hypothetical protein [Listeria booriae]MBC1318526.1 hypothetical protein [Listeria booriae]MBC2388835.1 hypothetical protein [Listeria booriae]
MRTAEKKLFASLSQAKSANNKMLKQEKNEEIRATLRFFNSNITSQLKGLSFYVKPRVRRQTKNTVGEKAKLYVGVVPKKQKPKQKRTYKRQQRQQKKPRHEFSFDDFIALPMCFVKDFSGNEYLINRALYHYDEQFAVNRANNETIDKVKLFMNARNIRHHDNTVIASRKTQNEKLRFIY